MIDFLKISSMAVFDEAEIEFRPGLNCITGETGAGKSLVMGALMLLMGSRASQDMVRPGAQKASIEALFTISGRQVVIRREIYNTGSSRCYIDGNLATVNSLAEFSSGLITIYGQHEYQDLLNPGQQMSILESLAGLRRDDVQAAFDRMVKAAASLKELEKRVESSLLEQEETRFILDELLSVDIEPGLEEQLSSELNRAQRAAELKMCVHLTEDILYSGSSSVMELVSQARAQLSRVLSADKDLEPLVEQMGDLSAQVEDISRTLREKGSTYEYDDGMIGSLEERLHFLQDLKRKHRTDEQGLVQLRNELQERLSLSENSDQLMLQAGESLAKAREAYAGLIRDYLKRRRDFSLGFCRKVNKDLKALGMPGTEFLVLQAESSEIDAMMSDPGTAIPAPGMILKGEFIISTNVGQKALPLSRIVSGGELSRLMLAIKVQQKASQEATLIFDEIDSGISGQTAIMISQKLKDLSGRAQAIVVTHLHQVASVSDVHFVIEKKSAEKVTISTIHEVAGMERVLEIARMMGGEAPSQAVIDHAKELMGM